jgi:hypothetical protein
MTSLSRFCIIMLTNFVQTANTTYLLKPVLEDQKSPCINNSLMLSSHKQPFFQTTQKIPKKESLFSVDIKKHAAL